MNKGTISTTKSSRKVATSRRDAEYVIPLGGTGWVVKSSRAKKFTAIADSKGEAIRIARALAKQYGRKLVIFAKDGSVQQQVSYAL